MFYVFLLPCIAPHLVHFSPIEVSEQIRPQHEAGVRQNTYREIW